MAKKLNDLLAEYGTVRDGIKDLQAQEKELNTLKRELEGQIAIRMTEEGLDKISNGGRTVSLKNEIVPDVEDWDALQQHVAKTGEFELLHRRVSATAYREKVSLGADVPGVTNRELTRINYRST
tara:strand:- start:2353 stop:2724 length:372 start_codon:yes stop_codon:yes gene_type:complete